MHASECEERVTSRHHDTRQTLCARVRECASARVREWGRERQRQQEQMQANVKVGRFEMIVL